MSKIVKYIDLFGAQTATRANAGAVAPNYTLPWTYYSGRYDGTVAVYFEAVIAVTAGTGTAYAELAATNTQVTGSQVSTTATSPTTLRSGDLFSQLANATAYRLRISSTNGSTTCTVYSARLIIVQTGTITKTETCILIGGTYNVETTSYADDTNKGYFKYKSGWWDGTIQCYNEALMSSGAAGNNAYVSLHDTSDNLVTGSECTSSSTTDAAVTSGSFSLSADTTYKSRVKIQTAGAQVRNRNQRIIIVQTNFNKTATYIGKSAAWSPLSSSELDLNTDFVYDTAEWSVDNNDFFTQGTIKAVTTQTVYIDINDGSSDVSTASTTGTVLTWVESSEFTPVDDTTYHLQTRSSGASNAANAFYNGWFTIFTSVILYINVAPAAGTFGMDTVDPTVVIGGGGGGVTVEPAAATFGVDAIDPAVVHGSLTLAPSAGTFAVASVAPTIVLGSTTASPTAGTFATSVNGPTVVLGSLTLSPTAGTFAVTVVAPTIINNVTLSPTAGTFAVATVNPTVVHGSLTLSPSTTSFATAVVAPTVILGSVTVGPAPGTFAVAVAGPVIINNVTLTPSAVLVGIDTVDPTIVNNVTLTPAVGTFATTVVAPVVVLGSSVASPAAGTVALSVQGPTVVLGSTVAAPAAGTFVVLTIDPTVIESGGGTYVEPAASSFAVVCVAPTVVLGSVVVSPAAGTFAVATVAPAVVHGSLSLTPSAGTFGIDTIAPVVIRGSLVLTPTASTVRMLTVALRREVQLIYENFTGTNGDEIYDTQPDLNNDPSQYWGWSDYNTPGYSGTYDVQGNKARSLQSGLNIIMPLGIYAGFGILNVHVRAKMVDYSSGSAPQNDTGLFVRGEWATGSTEENDVISVNTNLGVVRVVDWQSVSGGGSIFSSIMAQWPISIDTGEEFTLEAAIKDYAVTVYVNGSPVGFIGSIYWWSIVENYGFFGQDGSTVDDFEVFTVEDDVILGDTLSEPTSAAVAFSTVDPVVVLGSLSLAPAPDTFAVSTVNPSVIHGSLSITPGSGTFATTVVAPSVVLGSTVASPAASTFSTSTVAPTTILGSLSLSPGAGTFGVDTVDPTVIRGSISLSSIAQFIVSTVGPTVIVTGDLQFTPDPVTFSIATLLGSVILEQWQHIVVWDMEIATSHLADGPVTLERRSDHTISKTVSVSYEV